MSHKSFRNGFTLIELIVVIAIIAILGTAGTLTLTKWFSQARDSGRMRSLVTISTALEVSQSSEISLPVPDDSADVVYNGDSGEVVAWRQGTIGSTVISQLESMSNYPKDSDGTYYKYSLSSDGVNYQLLTKLENTNAYQNINNVAYSASGQYNYMKGNHKGYIDFAPQNLVGFRLFTDMFVVDTTVAGQLDVQTGKYTLSDTAMTDIYNKVSKNYFRLNGQKDWTNMSIQRLPITQAVAGRPYLMLYQLYEYINEYSELGYDITDENGHIDRNRFMAIVNNTNVSNIYVDETTCSSGQNAIKGQCYDSYEYTWDEDLSDNSIFQSAIVNGSYFIGADYLEAYVPSGRISLYRYSSTLIGSAVTMKKVEAAVKGFLEDADKDCESSSSMVALYGSNGMIQFGVDNNGDTGWGLGGGTCDSVYGTTRYDLNQCVGGKHIGFVFAIPPATQVGYVYTANDLPRGYYTMVGSFDFENRSINLVIYDENDEVVKDLSFENIQLPHEINGSVNPNNFSNLYPYVYNDTSCGQQTTQIVNPYYINVLSQ